MRKLEFVNNHIYHVLNRGVEKRAVFVDDSDRLRFIRSLLEFNDISAVANLSRRLSFNNKSAMSEAQLRSWRQPAKETLVDILAFCLMPNHYHLLLRQRLDGGITKFMHKVGTGYTNYFNQKNERVGSLFQGRFKAVLIEDEYHFARMPFYIHLNPLDLVAPEWREKRINSIDQTLRFLESYKWSSYLDYIGNGQFSSVINKEFITEFFGSPNLCKKRMEEWLREMNLENIRPLTLE